MEQPASLPLLIPGVSAVFLFFSHTSRVKGIPCLWASANLQRTIIVKGGGGAQRGGMICILYIPLERIARDVIS